VIFCWVKQRGLNVVKGTIHPFCICFCALLLLVNRGRAVWSKWAQVSMTSETLGSLLKFKISKTTYYTQKLSLTYFFCKNGEVSFFFSILFIQGLQFIQMQVYNYQWQSFPFFYFFNPTPKVGQDDHEWSGLPCLPSHFPPTFPWVLGEAKHKR